MPIYKVLTPIGWTIALVLVFGYSILFTTASQISHHIPILNINIPIWVDAFVPVLYMPALAVVLLSRKLKIGARVRGSVIASMIIFLLFGIALNVFDAYAGGMKSSYPMMVLALVLVVLAPLLASFFTRNEKKDTVYFAIGNSVGAGMATGFYWGALFSALHIVLVLAALSLLRMIAMVRRGNRKK